MRYRSQMRHSLAALLILTGPALAAEPIVGRASVTDGDTVVIRGTRIRLHGIDAPESAQLCQDAAGKSYRCGQVAALALADRIGEANISCEPRDTDRYGRTVAVCRKGDEDLNAWMVSQGYATAYQRYSRDYVGAETTARALKRGLWAGTFDPPSDWRRAKRASGIETRPEMEKPPAVAPAPLQAACAIKGNISRKGDKIYHLPGTRDYDRTVIATSSGERMFCSEDEAKAAGWRGARG
ncbi:thermonuclease family protein [Methylobacterium sp. NPDC080182]|uniref:thermonuclease family protein n=1 Tax=Methylobacterium sp. NPDC080182 TaxID=3390590 RepID=UPI003CFF91B8